MKAGIAVPLQYRDGEAKPQGTGAAWYNVVCAGLPMPQIIATSYRADAPTIKDNAQ